MIREQLGGSSQSKCSEFQKNKFHSYKKQQRRGNDRYFFEEYLPFPKTFIINSHHLKKRRKRRRISDKRKGTNE